MLNRLQAFARVQQLLVGVPGAGQEGGPVAPRRLLPEGPQLRPQPRPAVRLRHHQRHPGLLQLDLIHCGQRQDPLVAPAVDRHEQLLQPHAQLLDGLLRLVGLDQRFKLGVEVLDVAEVELAVAVAVQVPRRGRQLGQHVVLEPRQVAPRLGQVSDQLGDAQPHDRIGHVGQRCHQQQPAGVLGIGRAEVGVHHLGHGCAVCRNVVGNGVGQAVVDLGDLATRVAVVEVQIVRRDQQALLCQPQLHSRAVAMRIRRIRPRVCWKPGFSRKRA